MKGVAGKTAIVSGGATSLGAAITGAFHAAGARVVIADIAEAPGRALAARLGEGALFQRTDVTRDEDLAACAAAAAAAFGGIDILVNGAGVAPSAPLVKTSDEEWNAVLQVNLSGAFYCMREALPEMLERGWGRVVNVASIAGKTGQPYIAAYAASKHGLLGLTRCAALEVAARGVTVNAVCPGYVDTPMTDASVSRIADKTGLAPDEIRKRLERMSPQGRLVGPEEVAALVRFLCGDEARGINGQALSVDGGTVVCG
jgi:NAD(P)-dependent dehydrogenase (short-subunit alcohol dehydrogenase family)